MERNDKEIDLTEEDFYIFSMENIDTKYILSLCNGVKIQTVQSAARKLSLIEQNAVFHAFICQEGKKIFRISIAFDQVNRFKVRCSCGEHFSTLCKHTAAAFFYLSEFHGNYYFSRFKFFKNEKNALLKPFGLTVEDPEAADFSWSVSYDGILSLTNKPSYFVDMQNSTYLTQFKKALSSSSSSPSLVRARPSEDKVIDYDIGFLFNFSVKNPLCFDCETLFVREKKGQRDLKKMQINNASDEAYLLHLNDSFFSAVVPLSKENQLRFIHENGYSYINNLNQQSHFLDGKTVKLFRSYYHNKLRSLWPHLTSHPHLFKLIEGNFSSSRALPMQVSEAPAKLIFKVLLDKRFLTIVSGFDVGGNRAFIGHSCTLWAQLFVEYDEKFHLIERSDDLSVIDQFATGRLKFPFSERILVLKEIVTPLIARYPVAMDESLNMRLISCELVVEIHLSELDNKFFIMKPVFLYDDVQVAYRDGVEALKENADGIDVIRRNLSAEKEVFEFLQKLHPKFDKQPNNSYFFLPFEEVMKGGWFLSMNSTLTEAGYTLRGLSDLKKFKYNTSKPTFKIETNSSVDWFDLLIDVSWGDQHVSVKDIRKAILAQQDAVLLGDGTLGLIPEDWIEKYGLMLKLGSEDKGKLLVSKLHFAVLDGLDASGQSADVQNEIQEKKKRLSNFAEDAEGKPLSPLVTAQLRPYQMAGFKWLQVLDRLGWGGCLADDMGLGKTVQTISFLQYLKEEYAGSTHLIVCPTSLIFNWENELKKFCPSLRYHTYYGSQRTFDEEHFEHYDVVLTSYGVVRIDSAHLLQFKWKYIVLDESQAIKNPDAQLTRSLNLFSSGNRLALSGTPVQNNTSDLFAQFNFLNPGFLGSKEFFKREFGTPIDKLGDKSKSEQLRRMVYPFLLRRTKKQVATDLPDKTESILWCNMGSGQRAVYDEYKKYYRENLLQKIEDQGLARSGLFVLEGLLRLRQICDHPTLAKAQIKAYDKKLADCFNESVKLDELIREINESNERKILIFSQFTEMLALLQTALDKNGTSYAYLDGSTPLDKRKSEVARFQEDGNVQVFLMSLKAGGVGLNLTAAEYVYILDPWWNPAAEQQAIDRTYRIGQVHKIFAYKMICKDTVEEKILLLQQRKKSLTDDLIGEDAGFVKKLTKEDISFLFS